MIVASATSKWGGACTDCGAGIPRGGAIFKVATEGKTTQHGQGPGRWVGACCRNDNEDKGQPLTLFGEGNDGH